MYLSVEYAKEKSFFSNLKTYISSALSYYISLSHKKGQDYIKTFYQNGEDPLHLLFHHLSVYLVPYTSITQDYLYCHSVGRGALQTAGTSSLSCQDPDKW